MVSLFYLGFEWTNLHCNACSLSVSCVWIRYTILGLLKNESMKRLQMFDSLLKAQNQTEITKSTQNQNGDSKANTHVAKLCWGRYGSAESEIAGTLAHMGQPAVWALQHNILGHGGQYTGRKTGRTWEPQGPQNWTCSGAGGGEQIRTCMLLPKTVQFAM